MTNTPTKQELEHLMKVLELTEAEALQLWKEDHGLEEAPQEQIELDAKAKQAKVKPSTGRKPGTQRKPPTRKENKDKQAIITGLFNGLAAIGIAATIANNEKYIDFIFNDVSYTVNLVAHRPAKK